MFLEGLFDGVFGGFGAFQGFIIQYYVGGEHVGFAFQGPYVYVVDSKNAGDVLDVCFDCVEVDVFGDALQEDVDGFSQVFGYVVYDENG